MLKIMFKVLTVGLMLSASIYAFEQRNPMFDQLKTDMWSMGLDFDYVYGDRIVSPRMRVESGSALNEGLPVFGEEIYRAMDL